METLYDKKIYILNIAYYIYNINIKISFCPVTLKTILKKHIKSKNYFPLKLTKITLKTIAQ